MSPTARPPFGSVISICFTLPCWQQDETRTATRAGTARERKEERRRRDRIGGSGGIWGNRRAAGGPSLERANAARATREARRSSVVARASGLPRVEASRPVRSPAHVRRADRFRIDPAP